MDREVGCDVVAICDSVSDGGGVPKERDGCNVGANVLGEESVGDRVDVHCRVVGCNNVGDCVGALTGDDMPGSRSAVGVNVPGA